MDEKKSYFSKLKFDPKLSNSWVGKFLGNPRLVILILLSVIFIGSTSYASLPRRLNPEVKIPLVIVSTILPGANPQDVESLVTIPIEDVVRPLENITTVTSSSQDNVSVIQIEFSSGIDPDDAKSDVQSAVDQADLPDDAIDPQVQKIDFENQPVWTFVLTSNSDFASLTRLSKNLREDLEDERSIDRVRTGGLDESEVSIVIEPEKLTSYNINTNQISQIIRTSLASFPAGSIENDTQSLTLSLDPQIMSIEDIRNLKINLNNSIVPLSAVATVTEKSKPSSLSTFYSSKSQKASRAVVFDVYKTTTSNIDAAARDAEKIVEESLKPYGDTFEIKSITNTQELISEQFGELIRDFMLTVILVFIVLFIFLGARQAFVSFFAVPLTFLISFTVMNYLGISLNFLSMFSLLLSLGLLVDDTIVVISAMTAYFRVGKFTPIQTGLLVWRDFWVAILTTTLTTVWAFLPLLLATGIIGEFIKSIPIVVSTTLIASFFVAMFLTLPLMVILLKPQVPYRVKILFYILLLLGALTLFIIVTPKGVFLPFALVALLVLSYVVSQIYKILLGNAKGYVLKTSKKSRVLKKAPRFLENGLISFSTIEIRYRKILTKILRTKANRRKAVIMVVVFSVFSYLLLPLGFVKNEFFPASDENNLYVSIEMPSGTSSKITENEAKFILNETTLNENVLYGIADIGQSFSTTGGTTGGGGNVALVSLTLINKGDRTNTSSTIAEELRESLSTYEKGTVTVTEVSGGPPAGADIQIKLFGEDLSTLNVYADKIVSHLENERGAADATKSVKEGASKIAFIPDGASLARYNLTPDSIGFFLRTFASGIEVESGKITGDKDEEQDITLRLGAGTQRIEDVTKLSIGAGQGNIPLTSLGEFKLKANPSLITRENGQRTISVTAAVTGGGTTTEINKRLEEYADSDLNLPDGYSWATGGVNEENQKSVNSILTAMLLSFLLIVVTMVIQFSSFRKAVIVMLVIPLSISGVFIIFALTNTPLSFPALIGVLALFGIVVKNSILIVDKITANEKTGMEFLHSIVEGTESRLEPIALTTLATIMGLTPITLSNPLWRGLGGAIIAGLIFSGTIMLFFIPVVYYMWMNKKRKS